MAADVAVAAAVLLFATLALALADAVADSGRAARGVGTAGTALRDTGRTTAAEIRRGFDSAADAAARIPLVGPDLAAELRLTGVRNARALQRQATLTGAELERSSRLVERDARRAGRLAGWIAFLMPTILLAAIVLPQRLRGQAAGLSDRGGSGASG